MNALMTDIGGLTVRFVGRDNAIRDISTYLQFYALNNKRINIDNLIERVLTNKIYGYISGKSSEDKETALAFNSELYKKKLLINDEEFAEAMYFVDKDKFSKMSQLSEENEKWILENSRWPNYK